MKLLTVLMIGCASAFDVTAFSNYLTKTVTNSKWLREAEKKHGRVALLAVPSLATIAMATGNDPVPWLNSQPIETQIVFYSTAGLLESFNLRRFDKGFRLKDDEEPGKLLDRIQVSTEVNSLEDNAGRVAMLIAASVFANSVTHGL